MEQPSGTFVAVGHSTRDEITLASGERLPPVAGGCGSHIILCEGGPYILCLFFFHRDINGSQRLTRFQMPDMATQVSRVRPPR